MRLLSLTALLVFFALPAQAQNLSKALVVSSCGLQSLTAGPQTNLTMNPAGQLCIGGSLAPPYTGPLDVVTGAKAWFGLRASSGTYASATGKAVNLRRASDNTQCDFDVALGGGFGTSDSGCSLGGGLSLAAFATQDATATCTIAAATATCTSGSGVPHAGSTLTGTGVNQPCYASAAGSGTAASFTIALAGGNGVGTTPCGTPSGAAVTFTYGLYATQVYDQSGANACSAAPCHVVQATAAKQPQLLPTCINGLPCLSFVKASLQWLTSAVITAGASVTGSAVYERNQSFTAYGVLLGNGAAASPYFTTTFTANTTGLFAGTLLAATAADSVFHANQYVFAGASSVVSVDGVSGAPGAGGAGSWNAATLQVGADAGANNLGGYVTEVGLWNVNFTAPQLTSMCHNQYAYWGTPTAC